MTREDIKLILKAFYKVNNIERKVHGEQGAYEYSQTMEYYDDILMHYYDLKGKSPLPSNLDEAAELDSQMFGEGMAGILSDYKTPEDDTEALGDYEWHIAKYFYNLGKQAGAEWGEKNAYKAIMKKADEVRDKRFDADYEVKIEPAAGFNLGCINVYHEGKLVGQYVEAKEEKKLPEDLDEAADEYASDSTGFIDMTVYNTFIAGAKWMVEQLKK